MFAAVIRPTVANSSEVLAVSLGRMNLHPNCMLRLFVICFVLQAVYFYPVGLY
jgi:hypothetical protein